MSMTTLAPVDPATEPFLSGRFAPVHDEINVEHLEVRGSVPRDLCGAYFRNGPNPKFTPLGSYTYPFEGDGMVHGVWFEDGKARYANRFVRTQSLLAEERAGHALFGGVMTPAFVDKSLLGDDPDPDWPFKLDAFVNVVRHGGRYLALEEGSTPYEIGADLRTIGRYDFAGALPAGMTAHPKIDPVTGDMVIFRYGFEAPFLTWTVVGADGAVVRPPVEVAGIDQCFMIHDCAITEHYLVLVIGPLAFDLTGPMPLAWKPELGTRIALIRRDTPDGRAPVRWVHTDAFWAWHYANAFELADRVVIDFPWWSGPRLVLPQSDQQEVSTGFVRATVDPDHGTVDIQHLDDNHTEYPRVDDRLLGRPHRYLTVAGWSGDPRVKPGEHDILFRYDMATGTTARYDANAVVGEAVYAPRQGGTDELDGYYIVYASDFDTNATSLLVFDAATFPSSPIATIAMPQRVPNGLHGSWFPAV
jgi:carotenoid cleavage dioxygenase